MNIQEADKYFIHTYNRNVIFDKGEGMYLYDDQDKAYLDMGAGIAVSALGYSNEAYKQALKEQIDCLIHVSNLYYTKPSICAAKCLCEASGMDKVFFTNSGAEAIEGAIKLARKYARVHHPERKGEIIAMEHSFHGRTMGALSVTGKKQYREDFEPLIGGVSFACYNDLESVKALVTDDTCGIILETLQGEGGIYPADTAFIQGLRKLCDERDIALILDEIQCGMGRTGTMYAYEHYGIKPDIMTTAKALGCGVPIGAFAAVDKFASAMVAGDHGTTYGGNPLATAAVCKVFELFETEKILEHVQEIAPYLSAALNRLAEKYPAAIKEIRGMGLMLGMELTGITAGEIVTKAMERGLVLIAAGTNIVRFVPPLVVQKEHIDKTEQILGDIFAELSK